MRWRIKIPFLGILGQNLDPVGSKNVKNGNVQGFSFQFFISKVALLVNASNRNDSVKTKMMNKNFSYRLLGPKFGPS